MDISVVIVSWNVKELLRNCVRSLKAQQGNFSLEIIIVDNNSHDDSLEEISRKFPDVTAIQMGRNSGYATACNRGIQESTGKYVFILNPDTEVPSTTLQTLFDYGESHSDISLIGPKIVNKDRTFQFGSLRRNPTLFSQLLIKLVHAPKIAKMIPSLKKYFMLDVDPDQEQDVEQVMGSAMFFRRSALDEVSNFDEKFFLWFEEVDICYRIAEKGRRMRYVPDATVIHLGGQSFAQEGSLKKQRMYNKSLIRYFYKHHGLVQAVILMIVFPMNLLLVALASLIKRS